MSTKPMFFDYDDIEDIITYLNQFGFNYSGKRERSYIEALRKFPDREDLKEWKIELEQIFDFSSPTPSQFKEYHQQKAYAIQLQFYVPIIYAGYVAKGESGEESMKKAISEATKLSEQLSSHSSEYGVEPMDIWCTLSKNLFSAKKIGSSSFFLDED